MKPKVHFRDLGKVDHQEAWDLQESLLKENIDIKVRNRKVPEKGSLSTHHHLLFCEHPHVYTMGKSGKEDHLLIGEAELADRKATFSRINRGGDITYHGPGQLVAYPIFDLDHFFTDIHQYLRYLEEAVILTLDDFGIRGGRLEGATGVWLDPDDPEKARKICAMGVKCSRWVTMHGLALNVNTDLSWYSHIVPCGIPDKDVTSMERELGQEVAVERVKNSLKHHLAVQFGFDYRQE